jgi:uncharacterized protein
MICPICGKAVAPTDPYMPFCSDRCRVVDLANWASEKYSIPVGLNEDDVDQFDGEGEDENGG